MDPATEKGPRRTQAGRTLLSCRFDVQPAWPLQPCLAPLRPSTCSEQSDRNDPQLHACHLATCLTYIDQISQQYSKDKPSVCTVPLRSKTDTKEMNNLLAINSIKLKMRKQQPNSTVSYTVSIQRKLPQRGIYLRVSCIEHNQQD